MASTVAKYKESIRELKQLHNPPITVKDCLYALCLLLGYSEQEAKDWKFIRKLLQSSDLAIRLQNHQVKTCSPENVRKANAIMHNISMEAIQKVSLAATMLYEWNSKMISSYSS